ncbi:thioredoxin fold domain-containing protein [Arcobacter vandammei]|uniref:thioredoxin fold domain-containing protein n=1 Tax=Arcobacter vandammei TaxID=2782243 RepID=UPI0018DF671D|nr:thioredoxin fold domain-containing protein [Arcobacter vandammei]
MSYILKIVLLTFLFANYSFAALKELSKSEAQKLEQLELLKKNSIKINKAFDIGSLFMLSINVKGNSDEIFLTKDKNYLISGVVVDVKSGNQVSTPVDLTKLKNKEAFTYGNGKDEYILFTDPECQYCKKFEAYFPQIKDKVKIKIFFYPLDFHENAKNLSLYIMGQKTNHQKIDAMFEFNIGDDLSKIKNMKYSKTELDKLEKKLNEHINLAQELNIQSTPSLFDKDGNSIIWIDLLESYGIEVDLN